MGIGKWIKGWTDGIADLGMFSLLSVNAQDIKKGLLCWLSLMAG